MHDPNAHDGTTLPLLYMFLYVCVVLSLLCCLCMQALETLCITDPSTVRSSKSKLKPVEKPKSKWTTKKAVRPTEVIVVDDDSSVVSASEDLDESKRTTSDEWEDIPLRERLQSRKRKLNDVDSD